MELHRNELQMDYKQPISQVDNDAKRPEVYIRVEYAVNVKEQAELDTITKALIDKVSLFLP